MDNIGNRLRRYFNVGDDVPICIVDRDANRDHIITAIRNSRNIRCYKVIAQDVDTRWMRGVVIRLGFPLSGKASAPLAELHESYSKMKKLEDEWASNLAAVAKGEAFQKAQQSYKNLLLRWESASVLSSSGTNRCIPSGLSEERSMYFVYKMISDEYRKD